MREPRWSDPVAATIIARLDKIGPHRIARLVGRRRPSEARDDEVLAPISGTLHSGTPMEPAGRAPSPLIDEMAVVKLCSQLCRR